MIGIKYNPYKTPEEHIEALKKITIEQENEMLKLCTALRKIMNAEDIFCLSDAQYEARKALGEIGEKQD